MIFQKIILKEVSWTIYVVSANSGRWGLVGGVRLVATVLRGSKSFIP